MKSAIKTQILEENLVLSSEDDTKDNSTDYTYIKCIQPNSFQNYNNNNNNSENYCQLLNLLLRNSSIILEEPEFNFSGGKKKAINTLLLKISKINFSINKEAFDKGKRSKIEMSQIKDLPDLKFWYQRFYYYSHFDDGIQMDYESTFIFSTKVGTLLRLKTCRFT